MPERYRPRELKSKVERYPNPDTQKSMWYTIHKFALDQIMELVDETTGIVIQSISCEKFIQLIDQGLVTRDGYPIDQAAAPTEEAREKKRFPQTPTPANKRKQLLPERRSIRRQHVDSKRGAVAAHGRPFGKTRKF